MKRTAKKGRQARVEFQQRLKLFSRTLMKILEIATSIFFSLSLLAILLMPDSLKVAITWPEVRNTDSPRISISIIMLIAMISAVIIAGATSSGLSERLKMRTKRRAKLTTQPKFGEYLLYFFLSKKNRDSLLGDLVEEFEEVQKKFGRKPAVIWYYKQVVGSIGPVVWMAVKKLAKLGAITAVEEWIRRYI